MVWFQCEDCGDNLKKPKVLGHFNCCSARKLSCIDCGETFGREAVQGHTQCMTEAEKYGPKGAQGKPLNGGGAKPINNKDGKQQPDFDITVGLTKRFPWFCSLCNTKATSEQTLLLHAEGKKHRAKARAIHAAKQQPKQPEESVPDTEPPPKDTPKGEVLENKQIEEPKSHDASRVNTEQQSPEAETYTLLKNKKRKLDASKNDESSKKTKDNTYGKEGELTTKTKWKKLITSTLKWNDGVLKMRKLKKLVLKALEESGITDDETKLSKKLEHKINSSSKFRVDNKYVHLAAKD
ncbi:UBP1-associated proteins 1C-like isoform X2 [Malus sylvestris]|uniref:UBP1-associated proteins 1C-like isoform X2 n=1 Tax=Malus sylvestris TaxID=3752 RepID=UPI0021AD3A75|nr:UBP1-associated proteins 1C-like isoform X2 [Malus sylvestris]